MLIWVRCRLVRIIALRRAGHFDMGAQGGADRMLGREGGKPIDAGAFLRHKVDRNIEAARVERIAGQQNFEPGIIDHDRGLLMARRRNDAQNTSTKIEGDNVLGPVLDAEKASHVFRLEANDNGVRAVAKCRIACNMVTMAVAVCDNEWNVCTTMRSQPFHHDLVDGWPDPATLGSGIDQQRLVMPEYEIEERRFKVGLDRLP